MRLGFSKIIAVKVGVGPRREEVAPAGEGVEVFILPCFQEEDFLAPFCSSKLKGRRKGITRYVSVEIAGRRGAWALE